MKKSWWIAATMMVAGAAAGCQSPTGVSMDNLAADTPNIVQKRNTGDDGPVLPPDPPVMKKKKGVDDGPILPPAPPGDKKVDGGPILPPYPPSDGGTNKGDTRKPHQD